jgi:RecA-family ATPase
VLDLALATAAGRFTLGELKPAPGDVLYLALEDGKRRLQRRLTRLLPTFSETWPPGLTMATEWPRADQGGVADIERWIASTKTPRLVIIDTLAQFRKDSTGKQVYAEDYAAISGLQRLASKFNIAIVIVHHDRKSEADDVFDTVSGTLGLTGAADTILIMKRQAGTVTLHVRGRDIEEAEKALQFNKSSCKWTLLGEAAVVHRSDERSRVLAALEEARAPMSPKEIMLSTGMSNRNAVDLLLFKMVPAGDVTKIARALYCFPKYAQRDSGKIGKKERSGGQPPEKTKEIDNLSNLSNLSEFGNQTEPSG